MGVTRRAFTQALGLTPLMMAGSANAVDTIVTGKLHIRRYGPALTTDGNHAIITGGAPIGAENTDDHFYSSLLGIVESIDPVTLSQRFLANSLFPRANHAAVWLDGKLWLLGGRTRLGTKNRLLSETERIDLETQAIWRGPDLPIPLIHLSAVVFQKRLFVFGGITRLPESGKATASARVFECAPPYTQWQERSSMLAPLGNCTTVVSNKKIYVIGGYDRSKALALTQVFDPSKNTFSLAAPSPRPLSAHGTAAMGNTLVSFGDYECQSSLLAYDVVSNQWQSITLPFTPRRHVRATTVEDRVIVAGGNQSSFAPATDAIESYSIETLRTAIKASTNNKGDQCVGTAES